MAGHQCEKATKDLKEKTIRGGSARGTALVASFLLRVRSLMRLWPSYHSRNRATAVYLGNTATLPHLAETLDRSSPVKTLQWMFAFGSQTKFYRKCWMWYTAGQIVEIYRRGFIATSQEKYRSSNTQTERNG